jgi:hypothetical protein
LRLRIVNLDGGLPLQQIVTTKYASWESLNLLLSFSCRCCSREGISRKFWICTNGDQPCVSIASGGLSGYVCSFLRSFSNSTWIIELKLNLISDVFIYLFIYLFIYFSDFRVLSQRCRKQ